MEGSYPQMTLGQLPYLCMKLLLHNQKEGPEVSDFRPHYNNKITYWEEKVYIYFEKAVIL